MSKRLKDFLRFWTALCVFTGLFLVIFGYTAQSAPKWKDEVGIQSWCYDLKVIQDIVKAEVDGKPDIGDALATKAFKNHDCVRLPVPAAAFKPSGIAEKFPNFGGRPVTVVKGNLVMRDESLGREVYVMVPDSKLSEFEMTEPADSRPTPGVEFDAWQDV